MKPISDEDILAVRSSVTMMEVARYYNLKIHKGNMACCPLHGHDDTPSLKIYPGNRGFYCFGCHAGGDVIEFVKLHDGLEFHDAVRRLAQIFGIPLSDGDEISDDAKARIAKIKAERDNAARLRNLANERMGELADAIKRYKYWQRMCEPMDGLWGILAKRIEKAETEWEFLFYENAVKGDEETSE